jgi:hypothetical protein
MRDSKVLESSNISMPSQTGSIQHTVITLNEKQTTKSMLQDFLDLCSTPFAYDSGFYFQGKKTYHIKACSVCSILGFILLITSTVVLFSPVFSGETVYSKLETIPFNTPPDVPLKSSLPGGLAQFFGRKLPRPNPTLDLDLFSEQFLIVLYGGL